MYSIVHEDPEPLTALRTGVPIELEWIIDKTLAKDPRRRYQSAVELIVDLDVGEGRAGVLGFALARCLTSFRFRFLDLDATLGFRSHDHT